MSFLTESWHLLQPTHLSAAASTSCASNPLPESHHLHATLFSHSSTPLPSSCPPLTDLSSACSPTSDLRTPDSSSHPTALYATVARDVAGKGSTPNIATARPLRASLPSTSSLRCPFEGCGFSSRRPIELSDHQTTMHEFPCELGCPRSFTTRRGQERHHQGNAHRTDSSSTTNYQCGGCGQETPSTRRDNHRRHLGTCKKQDMRPYICHCGHPPTFSRGEHLGHVNNCKGKAGRPKRSRQGGAANEI
ncbi:hypothetical protein B0T16DRAFT_139460 [Cercophora newfieldiana]|uniref:C2H2-type domain-containing protein n=1 Tax=Cercophora newfieldiana TaxID=92897 RepID=A0AA39Y4P9_9PEZI|nr:hypothetical protein B0T16DRAFT_139460 [Cercophora newfieldiana]